MGKAQLPVFSERLITDPYGYAFGIAFADLDQDGDVDLTDQQLVDMV